MNSVIFLSPTYCSTSLWRTVSSILSFISTLCSFSFYYSSVWYPVSRYRFTWIGETKSMDSGTVTVSKYDCKFYPRSSVWAHLTSICTAYREYRPNYRMMVLF